ncbi:MAG TPA: DUF3465 domain-containing protein [Gammaproteobacteria bacterium]|jgi:hypothetical protein|nr:DUF3465 domain-containing protein [Gammaproteobacteria bacterium]
MKKLLTLVLVVLVAAIVIHDRRGAAIFSDSGITISHEAIRFRDQARPDADRDDGLAEAFEKHISNIHVRGSGTVIRILPDDDIGIRHQRFIVRLDSGQTLLIAHDIDIAPRVTPLHAGDAISFSGEYEWNSQGGVVHWTHQDPGGRHASGWLEHDGKIFQ